MERPVEVEMIRQMARDSMARNPISKPNLSDSPLDCADDLFSLKPANDWISGGRHTRPKMVFDNFWFENELCILFADTNVGKSILAVQLGNCIANGGDLNNFRMQMPASPVVYFDFEQSANQFEARYTDHDGPFKFSTNFFRAELNATADSTHNYLDRVHYCTEEGIRNTKAKVLIVDNLTYLANEAERARDALIMMKFLKKLKSKYGISILALAHTPKRNPARPITNNDMQGSKMLINFCDSAFAIGRSQKDLEMRYIKQIKQRNATETYGEERVCLFKIHRNGANLLFEHYGFEPEQEHLQKPGYIGLLDKQKIIALNKEGVSNRLIALQLGVARSSVARVLELEGEG